MNKADCIVIGAGVIGLAVARELAISGREVIILETAERIGKETSSRTGEVVHAGLHYPSGSLRARLCVEGRDLLYAYCRERGVKHRRTGELVIATEPLQADALANLFNQAIVNEVRDVQLMERKDVQSFEPGLTCELAILSPSTGIVDSHLLMKAFLDDATDAGAILVLNTALKEGEITGDGIILKYGGPEPDILLCRTLVNCAGIHAQGVAASFNGMDPDKIPLSFFCKGSYFTINRPPPVSRLIFSLPTATVPGIHLSFDLAGQARFGPDSQWTENIDHEVDPIKTELFTTGIRRYWPELPDGALQPGFAGYFARTYGPGDPVADWMIQGPADHGIPGLVNLFGIDSPGLTACMAIAEMVKGLVKLKTSEPFVTLDS